MELPAALRVPVILSYDTVAYDLRGKAVELLEQAKGIGFFEARCLEEWLCCSEALLGAWSKTVRVS